LPFLHLRLAPLRLDDFALLVSVHGFHLPVLEVLVHVLDVALYLDEVRVLVLLVLVRGFRLLVLEVSVHVLDAVLYLDVVLCPVLPV
jgi:hypothetical protein